MIVVARYVQCARGGERADGGARCAGREAARARLWVEKKPKWQALWEAKTKLRDAKDEQGRPTYSTRDWAAWVLTGEPD